MDFVVPWLVFPVVLGLLSLGCGLLVESAVGRRMRGALLLLPLGFSVIVTVSLLATSTGATAGLATPLVIALAVAGYGLSYPWRGRRFDPWAAVAAIGVFLAFGAPVLLSGQATFAGYIKLDDTAAWLGLTDRLIENGRSLSGLGASEYHGTLDFYWSDNGYPMGAYSPLGVGHVVVRTDNAWLFQPYLCVLAALLALSLYALLGRLIDSPRVRALAAFVAAQPALLYGYALFTGVKEIAVAMLIVLVAAVIPMTMRAGASARDVIPLATATAALVGVLSVSSGTWLVLLLVPAFAVGIVLRGRAYLRVATAFVLMTAVLSLPQLAAIPGFLRGSFEQNERGDDPANLIHTLSPLQVAGIWPVGDFRFRPDDTAITYLLIGVVVAAGLAGLTWAWRRRVLEVPLYVGAATLGTAGVVIGSSPWVGGKALAIASPAFLLAGMAGVAWLVQTSRRTEAAVVAAAIAGGVLWSNALAYHAVWLAPRAQLRELETIGERFDGGGPTLVTEYELYGARHFLRDMEPQRALATKVQPRQVPLRDGRLAGDYQDTDAFQPDALLPFRTLVIGRSPAASRPPSVYRRVWRGRHYDVWQRPVQPRTTILEHLPLGSVNQAAAVPRCADVLRLAGEAKRGGGELAAVFRPPAVVLPLTQASYPAGWADPGPRISEDLYPWRPVYGSPDVVYPSGSGQVHASVSVPEAGRYDMWIEGSYPRPIEVFVDRSRVARAQYQLGTDGVYTNLGGIDLEAGPHEVELRTEAADLRPGTGGPPFPLGPLVLSRRGSERPITYLDAADARSLCGKDLDWIEAVAR